MQGDDFEEVLEAWMAEHNVDDLERVAERIDLAIATKSDEIERYRKTAVEVLKRRGIKSAALPTTKKPRKPRKDKGKKRSVYGGIEIVESPRPLDEYDYREET